MGVSVFIARIPNINPAEKTRDTTCVIFSRSFTVGVLLSTVTQVWSVLDVGIDNYLLSSPRANGANNHFLFRFQVTLRVATQKAAIKIGMTTTRR